jgi:hypothetical protein
MRPLRLQHAIDLPSQNRSNSVHHVVPVESFPRKTLECGCDVWMTLRDLSLNGGVDDGCSSSLPERSFARLWY